MCKQYITPIDASRVTFEPPAKDASACRNTFWLNLSLHGHRAFTYTASAAMRLGLLWLGGRAMLAQTTTVGSLFALLRYVSWAQRAIKQASDAYARLMAGAGKF